LANAIEEKVYKSINPEQKIFAGKDFGPCFSTCQTGAMLLNVAPLMWHFSTSMVPKWRLNVTTIL
jgi:hypothetical protein